MTTQAKFAIRCWLKPSIASSTNAAHRLHALNLYRFFAMTNPVAVRRGWELQKYFSSATFRRLLLKNADRVDDSLDI
jgi:hypothetical protein